MDSHQKDIAEKAITGTFIWTFKKGDNIIYNFDIVWTLYNAMAAEEDTYRQQYYRKPIMVFLAAIIECILDDFSHRIQQRVSDPLPNVTPAVISDFKRKSRDKFETYISAVEKHNLLVAGKPFYDELHFLRKARNRAHIQNSLNQLAADERAIYTNDVLLRAEICFEVVIQRMMTRYYRSNTSGIAFADFQVPWSKHIKDDA
jgi:hypothetical protein